MQKLIILTDEIKNSIIKLYNEKYQIRYIAKTFNLSTKKITDFLKSNNIYRFKNIEDITIVKKIEDGKKYLAICPITNIEFTDFINRGGLLTTHIKKYRPEVTIPSNFLRKDYFNKNNVYWHEQYFDFKEINEEIKETLKCKYCNNFETIDVDNKSGHYSKHIKTHNISIKEHLINYPNEIYLFPKDNLKKVREESFKVENKDYVICKVCGKKLKQINFTHVNTHGLTISQYNQKFNFIVNNVSENSKEKLRLSYSKGLANHERISQSKAEIKISDFLNKNNIIHKNNSKNTIKGFEIDIFSIDKNIGIEYNGNFFHTEFGGKKDKNYHLNKTRLMNDKGYKLIHIFEDEFLYKKEIVFSKLESIFNIRKNKEKIYARKCVIKPIESSIEKQVFLDKNHIQGNDKSNIYLGAYYNDKLISLITFDNKRGMNGGNKNVNVYELKRFATDINYHVVGIASKLLNYFILNYKPISILSFADRRWTLDANKNLYTTLGFKLTNTSSPEYRYYNVKSHDHIRYHKFQFGKNKIKKKFPEVYDINKTESEMMLELGFDRIWDCGLFKYELNF